MITALCTRELPSRVNRNHLRASTSARYARTVRSPESRERSGGRGGRSRRRDQIYDTRLFALLLILANLKVYARASSLFPLSSFMIARQRTFNQDCI